MTPEFRIASPFRRVREGDFMLPSLEIAGPGGHWVEVSRALAAGEPSAQTAAHDGGATRSTSTAASGRCSRARPHTTSTARCRAASSSAASGSGHVTGHSIGMTMIEFPKIGEGVETELEANMVFSMHPHAISEDGRECLYMQDTWLVTAERRRAAGRAADADLPRRRARPDRTRR